MFPLAAAVRYFREHEGVVRHMYLDVVGLVTIGVGFMLPNPAAAQALKLVRRDTGTPATDEGKRQDWEAVRSRPKARRASAYRQFTRLDMPDDEIDQRLIALIGDFARNLRGRFPEFDRFPDPAQLGLLDMAYSLGSRGLFVGFPKFCAAVDAQDWRKCAQESRRRNVSESRNAVLRRLFLDAATVSTRGPAAESGPVRRGSG